MKWKEPQVKWQSINKGDEVAMHQKGDEPKMTWEKPPMKGEEPLMRWVEPPIKRSHRRHCINTKRSHG